MGHWGMADPQNGQVYAVFSFTNLRLVIFNY